MNTVKTGKFKILKAKISDASEIYHLGKRVHELDFSRKYPFHELSEIKEFIKHPKDNISLTAKASGKVEGFILAKILSHHAGGWCMLDNIAVAEGYRNQGAGEMLLGALYREVKKRKVWYIQILEEAHHKKTRSFWKKMGYKETKIFIWAEKRVRR